MNKQDIIGVWRSGGQKVLNKDGSVKSSRGPTPGYILYTPDDHMMVVQTNPEGVSTADPSTMSIAERAMAADNCTAYSGRYEVKNSTVYHHVDVAIFPAWTGKTRVRFASIDGKRMTFVTEPNADGTVSHIYWDRM